jgi:hypothetical protein
MFCLLEETFEDFTCCAVKNEHTEKFMDADASRFTRCTQTLVSRSSSNVFFSKGLEGVEGGGALITYFFRSR